MTATGRATFEDMLESVPAEKQPDILAERHERKRSSMNDIGGRAMRLCAALKRQQ